jgi:sirohydrochlorin ferrochelatase
MADATTIVLAAHGSRRGDANDAHRVLTEQVAALLAAPVRPAFLELAEPSIPAAIDAAVADGARRVQVLPYFLHPGNHTTHDLPAIVAEAGARHPAVDISLLGLFGTDGSLAEAIAAQIRAAADHRG